MINATQQLQLEQCGYTVLPNYLTTKKCAEYRAFIDSILPAPSPREDDKATRIQPLRHPMAGDPKTLVESLVDPRGWDIARTILRSDDLYVLEQLFVRTDPGPHNLKGPNGWHIDQSFRSHEYFGTPCQTYFQMVHCLSTVQPGGGAFYIVPGSHLKTLETLAQCKPEDFEIARTWNAEKLGIDINDATEICANEGDLLIFNPLALHSASYNTRDEPRYVLFLSFLDRTARRSIDWIRKNKYQRDFPENLKKLLPVELARRLDLPAA